MRATPVEVFAVIWLVVFLAALGFLLLAIGWAMWDSATNDSPPQTCHGSGDR